MTRTYNFTVFFERDLDGGYVASVPALPGCHIAGRTLEEAREMAIDAIRCYCASLLKHGGSLPLEDKREQFISYLSVPLELAA